MNNLALLHFTEANPPSESDSLTTDIIIDTDLTPDELDSLIIAISNTKEHADMGESISDFDIPDNWEDYGWDEKINIVCQHMSDFTGRFSLKEVIKSTTEVN